MSFILEIRNLYKHKDNVNLIEDVSLFIEERSITLITGENGAGKTTLFNLISGFEKTSKGDIYFLGKNISNLKPLVISKQGIVRLYQQPRVFKNLKVWENLVASADESCYCFSKNKAKENEEILKHKSLNLLNIFGLQDIFNSLAGELSYGQQKIVSFCMVKMNNPKMVLLDEPFAGLNIQMIDKLIDVIKEMRNNGATFIIIEHNIKKAFEVADYHINMSKGKIESIEKYNGEDI